MQALAEEINSWLENAVQNEEDPAGETGQKLAAMHKEWLTLTWPNYSKEAHAGVVQMYVDDERFTAFYDKNVTGCARFLRDAVLAYLNNEPATKK